MPAGPRLRVSMGRATPTASPSGPADTPPSERPTVRAAIAIIVRPTNPGMGIPSSHLSYQVAAMKIKGASVAGYTHNGVMKLAIALIKIWLLAEIVMAAIYLGQWQALRLVDPAGPPPPVPAFLDRAELLYLLVFLTAVAAAWRWSRAARARPDRLISLLILIYSLFSMLSFTLLALADTAGRVRGLYALDAAISLFSLAPGLSIISFIRRHKG